MISRTAKVIDLVRRQRADGVSYSALVSFDESASTAIRLSREEHDELARRLATGERFTLTIQSIDTTSQGGTT